MKRRKYKTVTDTINKFKTKSKFGFNPDEIAEIIKLYNLDADIFYKKLGVNTCMVENGKVITYHCDIELAIHLCLENREATMEEWD